MKKSIKGQILFGYMLIILIPIILTLVTTLFLLRINGEVSDLSQHRTNQNATKDAVVGHYSWVLGLSDTIMEGSEFTGSLDPTACGLGKWMSGVSPEDLEDPEISSAIDRLQEPHNEIHSSAESLIDLSKNDKDEAYKVFKTEIEPQVSGIIKEISIVTDKYKAFAEQSATALARQIITLIIVCIMLVVVAVIIAFAIGTRTAKKISSPIQSVAGWSQELALGYDNLDLSGIDSWNLDKENEVAIMVESFKSLASGLQRNVEVVKRVADGDLTAFVDIRSAGDSLGHNLYRLVQSNDHMFAEILETATNVAANANQIASASAMLAERSSEQAVSTQELTGTANRINDLTVKNSENVKAVLDTFTRIEKEAEYSSEQMSNLVVAVDEIRVASDRISAVIKSIDDISFQTNILALNAAIEAARAGDAGKGFAVVADEVRMLALKSAQAAEETKDLIENTIQKTHYGSDVAKETNETFKEITASISSTGDIVKKVAEASDQQSHALTHIEESMGVLSDIAASNAASCEESSAASNEMHTSAGMLREAMGKFNLRHREFGKPYIPKEKESDDEFIREATENYQKTLERHKEWHDVLEKI